MVTIWMDAAGDREEWQRLREGYENDYNDYDADNDTMYITLSILISPFSLFRQDRYL